MEQGPRWQPTTREKMIGGTVLVVVLLTIAAYSAEWTGFPGKTLWNWLQLLIVPAVIALGGLWFNRRQQERDQEAQDRREREREAQEAAQSERELEVENQRAQDEALQAYIDSMERLMLDKNLRNSSEDSEARVLARSRTLTVLPRLDGSRKASIIQFLYEAGLINKETTVIKLANADLMGANLMFTELREAGLREANLRGANLTWTDLNGADLNGAHLKGADLQLADLSAADLNGTDLRNTNLTAADLNEEELGQHLRFFLRGATMPNGQKYEDWLKDREVRGEN